MNRLFALFFLILLIPLILLLIILVFFFIDKKVFFIQERISLNNKFKCIKFATFKYNEFNTCNKPSHLELHRINFLGQLLRKFFLDEILQLINIINCDMNFFGPRPLPVYEDLEYRNQIIFWDKRNQIKPGLTGLAQSKGYFGSVKNTAMLKKRHAYDLLYAKKKRGGGIISISKTNFFILVNTFLIFFR